LIGSYLYRFQNELAEEPKGTPLDLCNVHAEIVTTQKQQEEEDNDNSSSEEEEEPNYVMYYTTDHGGTDTLPLPSFCTAAFSVSHNGKTRFYAVETLDEANEWVRTIHERQQECIKRRMGHMPNNSETTLWPKVWTHVDLESERLVKRNLRIKERLESMRRNDVDASYSTSVGGTGAGTIMTGGYYT